MRKSSTGLRWPVLLAFAKEFKFHHAAHAGDSAGDYAVEHGSWTHAHGPRRQAGEPRQRLLIGFGQSVDAVVADVKWLLKSTAKAFGFINHQGKK